MRKLQTIFFGTHDFAVTILKGLLESPLVDVIQVVTQPDKPVGRKKVLTPPPVKVFAEEHNIPVIQPTSLKKWQSDIPNWDISIVAQYGKIIPGALIDTPTHGTLNIHTSLLPKYRGASPIQSAIMNGDTQTGVTIMQMDEGLDTGPILIQKEINILPDETYRELDVRLAELGSNALREAIPLYIDGTLQPVPQDNEQATICKQLTRESGRIDWDQSAQDIYNQYRGLTPWPGVWTMLGDKRLKILSASLGSKKLDSGALALDGKTLIIGTRDGVLVAHTVQLEGKKPMDGRDFFNGLSDASLLLS